MSRSGDPLRLFDVRANAVRAWFAIATPDRASIDAMTRGVYGSLVDWLPDP